MFRREDAPKHQHQKNMNEIPVNHFDRAKPFYPLIMSYLFQLHGMKELAVRGIMGARRDDEEFFKAVSDKLTDNDSKQKITEFRANYDKFLGPLELRSEFQNNWIKSDTDEICRELVGNFSYLIPNYFRAALGISASLPKRCCAQWHVSF